MTRYLPPNLFNLFTARPPIEYVAPVTKRRMLPYTGLAQCMSYFPTDEEKPEPLKILNREERAVIKRKEKQERERDRINEEMKDWDPHNNPKATDEAYKTLFVCRLSFNTSESKLKREFEQYGPIKQIKLVTDHDNKPRGYAFIEFERERDMREAFKAADAKKIDDRRILVDVERGRTVKDWKPRKFGGGLGGTRLGSERVNVRASGRQEERPRRDEPARDERRDDRGRRDEPRRDDRRDERRDDRGRDERRDERRDDRGRDDRGREDRGRDDRKRDERRDDRGRDERRDDRRDERRDDRGRDDRKRERDDRGGRDEKRDDRGRDDRKREERDRDEKKEKRDRQAQDESADDRNVRARVV